MDLQLEAAELARMLKAPAPPHLLDVRQPDEHERVALPNSKLIPLGQLMQRAGEIEDWKNQEVVVYCHHGVRSLMAIGGLKALGFRKLRNLSGGIDAWAAEVEPAMARY